MSFEPKIVAFLCKWCSSAGADLAGVSRLEYKSNVIPIQVKCSGRVDFLFILKALKEGADGVLVSGCHPGDCHYVQGNMLARRRFAVLRKLLEFIGIEPDRFQVSWVSASEGNKFAQVIDEVTESVRVLGPQKKLKKVGFDDRD